MKQLEHINSWDIEQKNEYSILAKYVLTLYSHTELYFNYFVNLYTNSKFYQSPHI